MASSTAGYEFRRRALLPTAAAAVAVQCAANRNGRNDVLDCCWKSTRGKVRTRDVVGNTATSKEVFPDPMHALGTDSSVPGTNNSIEAPQQASEQSERKQMCKQAGTALSHPSPVPRDASRCLRSAESSQSQGISLKFACRAGL